MGDAMRQMLEIYLMTAQELLYDGIYDAPVLATCQRCEEQGDADTEVSVRCQAAGCARYMHRDCAEKCRECHDVLCREHAVEIDGDVYCREGNCSPVDPREDERTYRMNVAMSEARDR